MSYTPMLKKISGFAVLFASYHAAEYMMLYKNSATAFLVLMLVFFIVAWLVARGQGYKGLSAWGMTFTNSALLFLIVGLLVGIIINTIAYITCLYFNIEVLSYIPATGDFIKQSSLLIFGTFFSSLSEDVLTRGYLYRHFNSHKYPVLFVLFSSSVYVLNHIHRLNEPVYLFYLFLIGVQLAIPLVFTKNIWYTLGCHWAGNIVYHITNTVMHSNNGTAAISSMTVFTVFMALLIPINYGISKMVSGEKIKVFPVLA